MHVALRKSPKTGRARAVLSLKNARTGRVFQVHGDGDDWVEATALAAQEMMQLHRAKVIRMTPAVEKRTAAVALLASPTIRQAVQAGVDAKQQALEAVKRAAMNKGVDVARAVASKAEDVAGAALKAVTDSLPGGPIAYKAGVEVWRQVKKIPFLGRLFG